MKEQEIKQAVRDSYARIAAESGSCCGSASWCDASAETRSKTVGYSDEDLAGVPEGANLGLGCGNPVAISSLAEGETVLDLGSGGGIDCFLAAAKVGPSGRVIGVDMTPQMIDKARENAAGSPHDNVEFRLGELEHLPVADGEVDVVISNCVINLVPDKAQVFAEAFRALAPGGRLSVSDIVLLAPWPEGLEKTVAAYAGCLAGAVLKDDYLSAIEDAGFEQIEVTGEVSVAGMLEDAFSSGIAETLDLSRDVLAKAAASMESMQVVAVKPA